MMRRRNAETLETSRSPFVLKNETGMEIVGIVERAKQTPETAPVVLIAPAYGKTIRDYFLISWYLLRHGLRVVRFDNTCHVGASEGEMWDFSLRSAIVDLQVVANFVTETVRPPSWGVVAPSLAFRVALRAFRPKGQASRQAGKQASGQAGEQKISSHSSLHTCIPAYLHTCTPAFLFSLVGVVNVRATLEPIIERDLFMELEAGQLDLEAGSTAFGLEVCNTFVTQAVEDHLETLESTILDLRQCPFPVVHVAGEDDPWVRLEEVEKVYAEVEDSRSKLPIETPGLGLSVEDRNRRGSVQSRGTGAGKALEHQLFYLPAVHHDLAKNPVAAALAMEEMVVAVSQYLGQKPIQTDDVIHPNLIEIIRVNKLEKALEKSGYRV